MLEISGIRHDVAAAACSIISKSFSICEALNAALKSPVVIAARFYWMRGEATTLSETTSMMV